MTAVTTNLLKEASVAFKNARSSVYKGAELLFRIQETSAWEGAFSSLWEYVEQECQISRGTASKLLTSWKFYVVDGGQFASKLEGIDPDKLYLATRLPTGSVEQRLVKAREWNRQDLRQALAEDENGGECPHPPESRVIICARCGKRMY